MFAKQQGKNSNKAEKSTTVKSADVGTMGQESVLADELIADTITNRPQNGFSPDVILALQRKIGNQAVIKLLQNNNHAPKQIEGKQATNSPTISSMPRANITIRRMTFEWVQGEEKIVKVSTKPGGVNYDSKEAAEYLAKRWYGMSFSETDLQEAVTWLQHFNNLSKNVAEAIVAMNQQLELGRSIPSGFLSGEPSAKPPMQEEFRPNMAFYNQPVSQPQSAATNALFGPPLKTYSNKKKKPPEKLVKAEVVDTEKIAEWENQKRKHWDLRVKTAEFSKAPDDAINLNAAESLLRNEGLLPANFPNHDPVEAKRIYRKWNIELHPDKPSGNKQKFVLIGKAWHAVFDENHEARSLAKKRKTQPDEASVQQQLRIGWQGNDSNG